MDEDAHDRACKAASIAQEIEDQVGMLTEEAFYMEGIRSSGARKFEYSPQVSPREIYYLNEALKNLKFAIEGIKY
tara:strand:- start:151 stop:375 length:225 start_codon:yes stop_codon:yes gene_type:complete